MDFRHGVTLLNQVQKCWLIHQTIADYEMVDIEHTCHSRFFAAMRETYVYYFMRQRKYILKASESTYINRSS